MVRVLGFLLLCGAVPVILYGAGCSNSLDEMFPRHRPRWHWGHQHLRPSLYQPRSGHSFRSTAPSLKPCALRRFLVVTLIPSAASSARSPVLCMVPAGFKISGSIISHMRNRRQVRY